MTDELCRQLRALSQHPGAPAAMAAVMGVAGAPRALLPLMAEPVKHALQVWILRDTRTVLRGVTVCMQCIALSVAEYLTVLSQCITQALSITARAQRPAFVKSFLRVLRSVLSGAAEEAADVWRVWQPCVQAVVDAQARLDEAQEDDHEEDEEDVSVLLRDEEEEQDIEGVRLCGVWSMVNGILHARDAGNTKWTNTT